MSLVCVAKFSERNGLLSPGAFKVSVDRLIDYKKTKGQVFQFLTICRRVKIAWMLFSSLRKHMSYDRTPRLHQLLGDYLALTSDYQEALDQYTQALR